MSTKKLWKQLWLLQKWPKLAPTLDVPKSIFGLTKVCCFQRRRRCRSAIPPQTLPLQPCTSSLLLHHPSWPTPSTAAVCRESSLPSTAIKMCRNHLQIHNLQLVYTIIDFIVKFRVELFFSFRAVYLTYIHHNCASTSITVIGLIVVFLQFVALPIARKTRLIPPRFESMVGCCVVLPPSATGCQSILIEHDGVWPPSFPFSSSIAPMQLSPTLHVRFLSRTSTSV